MGLLDNIFGKKQSNIKDLLQGVGQGLHSVFQPYANLIAEPLAQAGRIVTNPLYRKAIFNPNSFTAEEASKLNGVKPSTFLSPEQISSRKNIALTGLGSTAKAMLGVTGLANPTSTLLNAGIAGGLGYGLAKLGGNDRPFYEAGKGIGTSPLYAGVNRVTAPATDTVINTLMPSKANLLSRILTRGGIYGLSNALEQSVTTPLTEGRPATKSELAVAGGTGFLGGAGEEAFKSALQKFSQIYKSRVDPSASGEEVKTKFREYIRDRLGRFATQGELKEPPKWIGDMREAQGLPRHGDYESPLGLQAKAIGGTKAIFEAEKAKKSLTEVLQTPKTLEPQIPSPGALEAVSPEVPTKVSQGEVVSPSEKSIAQGNKYAFNINKEKLGLKGEAKQKMDQVVEQMRPVLEARKGKPLTDKEIIKGGRKAEMLTQVMSRDESKQFAEALQASRNFLKSEAGKKGLTPEFLAQLEIVSSQASDKGRNLRAFATNAEDAGIKEAVVRDLQKLGIETKRLIDAAKNVDWEDASQVTEFYRKFKPANLADKLEEYRYVNMLSSPNTHIVNAFSNVVQSGVVTPIEKTLTGALDFARSRLTGTEQKYFARQGVDYAKGYWKALPEGWSKFTSTLKGEGGLLKPDVEFIPTSTSNLHKAYTTPLRALEAMDQLFKSMTKSGELSSLKTQGITGAEAEKIAENQSNYRLFRQSFDPEGKLGQGKLLQLWDKWNVGVNQLRRLPGGKWVVPFLQTPTNILKQGVEYSPLGLSTIPGSKEPMVQLSKALVGTGVFTGAYALANSGLTTWDAPTDTKERSEFYAAGLQPYSVKIGDKWVSYSKLGPLSYPIAMAAAMKWAKDNGANDSFLETTMAGAGGFLQFFADQSYMQGIGDIIDAVRGDAFKQGRALANIPSQLIPYRAFQGWIARLVDPIYRKSSGGTIPEQIGKSILSQTPFLSKNLEPYTTPAGTPSERPLPLINAFSPLPVTQEKPQERSYYDFKQQNRLATKQESKTIKSLQEGKVPTNGKVEQRTYQIEGVDTPGYVVGNKFVYTDENGDQKTSTVDSIEKKQRTYEKGITDSEYQLQADRLSRANDDAGWNQLTQNYIDYLKQYKDSLAETDKKERLTVQNKIEDLEASIAKKKSAGGKKKSTALSNFMKQDSAARERLRKQIFQPVKRQSPFELNQVFAKRNQSRSTNLNAVLRNISKREFKLPTFKS